VKTTKTDLFGGTFGEHGFVRVISSELASPVQRAPRSKGLTQGKFAARLGVTFPTNNHWENGRAKPLPHAMKQIGDLLRGLGVPGKDLFQELLAGCSGFTATILMKNFSHGLCDN
jgi:transcriptional regulator with XRE-family HTH domain